MFLMRPCFIDSMIILHRYPVRRPLLLNCRGRSVLSVTWAGVDGASESRECLENQNTEIRHADTPDPNIEFYYRPITCVVTVPCDKR